MYQHHITPFGTHGRHELHDTDTGNLLSIVPAFGGCILDIRLQGHSILDGYKDATEMGINRWAKNLLLFPFPNRLRDGRYQWDGKAYQFPINDGPTGNALHGFPPQEQALEVTEVVTEAGWASIRCTYDYDARFEYYPFPFTLDFEVRISNPGSIQAMLRVRNDDRYSIPFGMGWHPYFQLGDTVDELALEVPPCEMVGIDQAMIPTGRQYEYTTFTQARRIGPEVLDNCFALRQQSGRVALLLSGAKGELRYWQETGPGKFGYLQLFTPPHRRSLAIEPMSCNIDAFNNGEGLLRLEAGQEATARFGFDFSAKK